MKTLPVLSLLCCLLTACSGLKYGVKETWVFTEERFQGNIQVDDDGNPISKGVTIETIVYLEMEPGDSLQWRSATINGHHYTITSVEQVNSPANAGKTKLDETPVIVNSGTGNKLCRLILLPSDKNMQEDAGGRKKIRLSGTLRGEPVSIVFSQKTTALLPQLIP